MLTAWPKLSGMASRLSPKISAKSPLSNKKATIKTTKNFNIDFNNSTAACTPNIRLKPSKGESRLALGAMASQENAIPPSMVLPIKAARIIIAKIANIGKITWLMPSEIMPVMA